MRVLVFHGYLLRGTGSNVYTANLAAALVRLGHEVHVVCQERHASDLSFVGTIGDWDAGELKLEQVRDSGCTVYRPNIGKLLPVYVMDRYEGIQARLFPQLSDTELEAYLRANVEAVAEVAGLANPNVALANHLVMGPAILARALVGTETPYAVKIHGSALEYTVKPYPRFLPYAREGIRAADGVLVSSRHTAESLWTTLKDPALPARTRLAPPGVDVSNFHPVERAETVARLRALADAIAKRERWSRSEPAPKRSPQLPGASDFARDSAATSNALRTLAQAARGERVVAFIGKLIVAKGIDLLLLAWPLVLASIPAVRLAVVGFGGYRAAAERLVDALAAGDLASIHALLSAGRAAEGGAASPLTFASSFLDSLARTHERDVYLAAARNMRERVAFTGRLEHDELGVFLPLCEAIVVPSTFPESFGMVAVEAAACGALPISAAHSGLAEVSRTLTTGLSKPVQELLSFNLDDRAVQSIAGHLIAWLRTPPGLRDVTRAHLAEAVAAHYSWDVVAQRVIAAAGGQLDQLVSPI